MMLHFGGHDIDYNGGEWHDGSERKIRETRVSPLQLVMQTKKWFQVLPPRVERSMRNTGSNGKATSATTITITATASDSSAVNQTTTIPKMCHSIKRAHTLMVCTLES